mgnify:CR=1 FL=1
MARGESSSFQRAVVSSLQNLLVVALFVFGFATLATGFLLFNPGFVAIGLTLIFLSWYQNEQYLKRRTEAKEPKPTLSAPSRPGFLKGLVLDSSTRHPVSQAKVTISGPTTKVVHSGNDGSFESGELTHGQYRILIEREGYSTATWEKGVISGFTSSFTYFVSSSNKKGQDQ